ncbi:MAG: peptidoglycan-binding protein [Bacteroidales bacterium]|jgi:peptidoglycan hydrolase-like protein with peptidoglycan-binding domain|nr:peptidoglycan-binding protein [Bacteroidales bacterium]
MTKTTKYILIAVVIAAIVAAIIIVQGKKSQGQSRVPGIGTSSSTANDFPLKNGVMNSDNVSKLQTHLNSKGASLVVDGDFGPLTEAALVKYYNTKEFTKAQFDQYVK